MKTCSDCKENDRLFSTNMNYRCCNDWCEWYIEVVGNADKPLQTPQPQQTDRKPFGNCFSLRKLKPKCKITDYYQITRIIKPKYLGEII
jgi:hypothetical protein